MAVRLVRRWAATSSGVNRVGRLITSRATRWPPGLVGHCRCTGYCNLLDLLYGEGTLQLRDCFYPIPGRSLSNAFGGRQNAESLGFFIAAIDGFLKLFKKREALGFRRRPITCHESVAQRTRVTA